MGDEQASHRPTLSHEVVTRHYAGATMILMTEELPFKVFARRNRKVKAVLMDCEFVLETPHGYIPGRRGDWLVEVAKNIRFVCDDKWFGRAYRPWNSKKKKTTSP